MAFELHGRSRFTSLLRKLFSRQNKNEMKRNRSFDLTVPCCASFETKNSSISLVRKSRDLRGRRSRNIALDGDDDHSKKAEIATREIQEENRRGQALEQTQADEKARERLRNGQCARILIEEPEDCEDLTIMRAPMKCAQMHEQVIADTTKVDNLFALPQLNRTYALRAQTVCYEEDNSGEPNAPFAVLGKCI